ncbi:MAG: hypothetical protein ABUK06_02590 [Dehalococcoidales bacterium]
MITPFERFSDVLRSDGKPSERFAGWVGEITDQINFNTVAEGSGSPEGVLTADITKLYMDTAGTAGNILYVKKTGNGNTGWILV